MESAEQPIVVSGIQTSGNLHIGNYFGAIVQFLELQDEFPGGAYFFLADYHALTTVHDAALLRKLTLDAAIDYLALGVDPEKAIFFRQSDVQAVCELYWLLNSVTTVSLLEKGVSYKDKVGKGISASTGLFSYPVLMAADILLYGADVVPVGVDQTQHIEFTRDIAGFFNANYASNEPLLKQPRARYSKGAKVPGLDGQKMSKSYGNAIGIFDEGESLRRRVSAVGSTLSTEAAAVLVGELYGLVASEAEAALLTAALSGGELSLAGAKEELLAALDGYFASARERRKALAASPAVVERLLCEGAERARQRAVPLVERCRAAVGIPG